MVPLLCRVKIPDTRQNEFLTQSLRQQQQRTIAQSDMTQTLEAVRALDQAAGSLLSHRQNSITQLEFHICRTSNCLTAASEETPLRAARLSLRRVAFRDGQHAPSALHLKPRGTAGPGQISASAKKHRELFGSLQNANAAKAIRR